MKYLIVSFLMLASAMASAQTRVAELVATWEPEPAATSYRLSLEASSGGVAVLQREYTIPGGSSEFIQGIELEPSTEPFLFRARIAYVEDDMLSAWTEWVSFEYTMPTDAPGGIILNFNIEIR